MVKKKKGKKQSMTKIGVWSFAIGMILAAIIAVFSTTETPAWVLGVLAVLGLLVGFMNVTKEESVPFLVASLAFLVSFQSLAATLSILTFGVLAKQIATFFHLLSVFIAPAAAIVAVIALYHIARD